MIYSAAFLLLLTSSVAYSFDFCVTQKSCVACTESAHRCAWRSRGESGSSCVLRTSLHSDDADFVFDDTCPVDYGQSDPFLSDWMGQLLPVVGDSPLLALSLPGTHDTLTYDLSTTVSEGGIDEYYKLAEMLHNKTDLVPDFIEDFMRSGAQTQDLSITQQLDAGIRFLDIRMMLEYSDEPAQWYSLHMMQSRGLSVQYFREIRAWMDLHPTEVVVMWLSKHGNECATGQAQYPNVSIEQKQAFWAEILSIFQGMTVDFSTSSLNETPLRTLLQRNHRAVFYVADYEQMTGYSPTPAATSASASPYYALDSCLIDNQLGNPSGPAAVDAQRALYAAADERKAKDMADQRLYLVSLVGGMDYVYAALLKFGKLDLLPQDDAELIAQCAATYSTDGMAWCPETLLDGSQLANYYTQVAMDELLQQMLLQSSNSTSSQDQVGGLPHAIYINAVGSLDGTIRTGTEVLWGKNRSPDHPEHATQGFAYVDSFLLYNVLRECNSNSKGKGEGKEDASCHSLTDLLVQRRAQHPLALWDDATYGRLTSW